MTSKNILISVAFFHPHKGGLEKYNLEMASELVRLGHKITIITHNTNQTEDFEIYDGIEIYRLPCKILTFGKSGVLPIPIVNKNVRNLLKSFNGKYDFLITNTRFFLINLLVLWFVKFPKKNILHIEHGSGYIKLKNPILNQMSILYDKILFQLMKLKVRKFAGVSEACNEFLSFNKINPIGIIFSGIVDPHIRKANKLIQLLESNKDKIIISFIGRIIEEKGILNLIEAFKILEKKYNNLVLMIAGTGLLLDDLKKYFDDKTIYLGNLESNEVDFVLNRTDIFINPSYAKEGGQRIILEAAINKCAIISTNVGFVDKIIEDRKNGLIIDKKNTNDIIEKIDFLIKNPQNIEIYSNNIYAKIKSQFSWSKTFDTMFEIFSK